MFTYLKTFIGVLTNFIRSSQFLPVSIVPRFTCLKIAVLLILVAIDAILSMDLPLDSESTQLIFLLTCKTAMVRPVFSFLLASQEINLSTVKPMLGCTYVMDLFSVSGDISFCNQNSAGQTGNYAANLYQVFGSV